MTSSCQVFILYDSGDQVAALAQAIAAGAGEFPAVTVTIKRPAQARTTDPLEADAIVLGTPNCTGITGLRRWSGRAHTTAPLPLLA